MNAYNYKQVAADYDDLAKQHQWQAPELLFNYLSGFVRKGTKLLDVGVGTGISSERFHSKQVELYGLDNSSDLLSICDAKGLFKELHLLDILKGEVPYPDETFDYVVCIGVLHFFSNLDEVFAKINRVLKYHGFFAFTFIENDKPDTPYITKITNGINLYYHRKAYIQSLAQQCSFNILYEHTFTTIKDLQSKETLDHTLTVARKE